MRSFILGRLVLVVSLLVVFLRPGAAQAHDQPIKVDVDLVLVNAAVTDSSGHSVTGLDKSQFQIWENKIQQEIQYFSTTEVPLSAVVVFDISKSMADKLPIARDAIVGLLRQGNPQDEYALVKFNSRPEASLDFTSDIAEFQNRIALSSATGSTALYDAVYMGMETLRRGHNPRKALLLVTDGEDNHSHYQFEDIKELVRESDAQVFAIRIGGYTIPTATKGHKPGEVVLKELVDLSGGELFLVQDVRDLDDICGRISESLRNEYVIGYASTNRSKDGRWRGLRLKVSASHRVSVHARSGYYTPVQ